MIRVGLVGPKIGAFLSGLDIPPRSSVVISLDRYISSWYPLFSMGSYLYRKFFRAGSCAAGLELTAIFCSRTGAYHLVADSSSV